MKKVISNILLGTLILGSQSMQGARAGTDWKQPQSFGPWQVMSAYTNDGRFDGCAAAIQGANGLLIVGQAADGSWAVIVPAADSGANTQPRMIYQYNKSTKGIAQVGIDGSQNAMREITPSDPFLTSPVTSYTVWLNNKQMSWALSNTSVAMAAIKRCAAESKSAGNRAVAPQAPLPAPIPVPQAQSPQGQASAQKGGDKKYIAIAFSMVTGTSYTAWGPGSQSNISAQAVSGCNAGGGRGTCKVVGQGWNICGSIAGLQLGNGSYTYYWATRQTRAHAQEIALTECRRRYGNPAGCQSLATACSTD